MDLTYQQVLADVYEENAKNVLVHQTEYDDEDQPAYEHHDYDANDLPDPDDFKKFAGDRGKPEHVIQPAKKPDGLGLSSIKKDSIFRTSVINIDGNFRANPIPTSSSGIDCQGQSIQSLTLTSTQSGSNFAFRTARQYKNVYSVQVSSVEFPNNFYSFSASRNNTSFYLVYSAFNLNFGSTNPLKIPDGNYNNIVNTTTLTPYLSDGITPDVSTLTGIIQSILDTNVNINISDPNAKLKIGYTNIQHLIFFYTISPSIQFTIGFPSSTSNNYNNGLGYNLGILSTSVTSSNQYVPITQISTNNTGQQQSGVLADTFPDVIQDRYIYLQLSDWDLISHQNSDQTSFNAFMKIPLTVPKFSIQFDSNTSNTISKQYFFHQPTNLNLIQITVLDAYGNVLDLKYGSLSMTLQIQEVLSTSTYQQLLDTNE
jgi:hypothetical protein